MEFDETCHRAAAAIKSAGALIITAGAGMGVDSGLPDFRGDKGFWRAYPMYERLGLSFVEAANPEHFERDPGFGWGFYGHRTNLYRNTVPHAGFSLLRSWIEQFQLHYFVVTSNVDGHFEKAGFDEDRILEVHGSIHHLQCTTPCSLNIWNSNEDIPVDTGTMRARTIPRCIYCRAVARPNILMFGDYSWISARTDAQERRFKAFLDHRRKPLVVIEMGAGTAIPTIRSLGERLGLEDKSTVIRINPCEPQISKPHLSLACGALEGLSSIGSLLSIRGA